MPFETDKDAYLLELLFVGPVAGRRGAARVIVRISFLVLPKEGFVQPICLSARGVLPKAEVLRFAMRVPVLGITVTVVIRRLAIARPVGCG